MAKFRKKPVVIDAVQWTGSNHSEIEEFCPQIQYIQYADTTKEVPVIDTLEGFHSASVGDWIIRGVKGEYYPCKDSIFILTYDPVD